MSIKLIYFVHGTTVANENNIAAGINRSKLSELGLRLSKEAAIQTRVEKYDAVFCSDLHRAKQTAEIFFDLKKVSIVYDSRLRECNYGLLNGNDKSKVVYSQHIYNRFEGGESLTDVETRIRSFILDMIEDYDGKTIAVVSHRAPQLAFEICTKNISWDKAIESDWRSIGKWQLGWEYVIKSDFK